MSRRIKNSGLIVEDEVDFDKYTVDCYLPELHIAIEWDGPSHGLRRKHDKKRDSELFEKFGLLTFRFSSLEQFESILEKIELDTSETYEERVSVYRNGLENEFR